MASNYGEDISNNLDEIRKELRLANQLKVVELSIKHYDRVVHHLKHTETAKLWEDIRQSLGLKHPDPMHKIEEVNKPDA